jgi:flagellar basal-body rod protein FlgB
MNENWINTPQYRLLERYLDVTSMRHSLVTGNLANLDTPGYQTRDLDFRGELIRAMDGTGWGETSPTVIPVRGLIQRPDGNNVSVDRETMLLSEVQLKFKIAAQLLRAELAQLRTAIHEGAQ